MRDLSLHLMDVIENALRAGASVISVTIVSDPRANSFTLRVEDNGPGLSVPMETATDPFYTTKCGKRTGLGLALLRAAAERAGGRFTIGRSALGGASVEAVMQRDHVDRSPLGDLATTLSTVVCTNSQVDWRFRLRVGEREFDLRTFDVAGTLPAGRADPLALARRVKEEMKTALEDLTP